MQRLLADGDMGMEEGREAVSSLLLQHLELGHSPCSRILDFAACAVRIGLVSPKDFVGRVLDRSEPNGSPRFGAYVELLGGTVPYLLPSTAFEADKSEVEVAVRAATLLAHGVAHGLANTGHRYCEQLHGPALECIKLLLEW